MSSLQPKRFASIDILRGLVMIIMALDHTRDFFHISALSADPLNPATTSVPLFFTRWITHYCAPVFVFLSGLSANIASRKKIPATASAFLIKRGIWLILIELVVVSFGLTFNPFYNFIVLQVIWVIGWSMILLGIFLRVAPKLILPLGLILFFGHNIFDFISTPAPGFGTALLQIFMTASGTVIPLDQSHFVGVFYAILPWTAVMFLGYSLGRIFSEDYSAARRQTLLLQGGGALIVLFFLIRAINVYGDPSRWQHFSASWQTILSFLNTTKYPPSLLYCCMTIGPGMMLLALLENSGNTITRFFEVYGKVPFFYYILHFYILHFLVIIVFFATGHDVSQAADPNSIFLFRPVDFGFSLPVVYLIWIAVVLSLYFPCRWFGRYKKNHQQHWWLSYL